ncbi:MAG: hypothetical protein AVDCRST_MAG73-2021, partial [uncultured Thermomicrobiales bacterium]
GRGRRGRGDRGRLFGRRAVAWGPPRLRRRAVGRGDRGRGAGLDRGGRGRPVPAPEPATLPVPLRGGRPARPRPPSPGPAAAASVAGGRAALLAGPAGVARAAGNLRRGAPTAGARRGGRHAGGPGARRRDDPPRMPDPQRPRLRAAAGPRAAGRVRPPPVAAARGRRA